MVPRWADLFTPTLIQPPQGMIQKGEESGGNMDSQNAFMQKEKAVRLNNLDIAKGIGILVVMLRHIMIGSQAVMDAVLLGIGNYCMPMFFFASGYVFRPGKGAAANLKKRIPMLLRVYFLYAIVISLLLLLLQVLAGNQVPAPYYFSQMRNFFLGKNLMELISPGTWEEGFFTMILSPYWFLVQMILASLLFYPLAEKVVAKRSKGILTILILFVLSFVLCQFELRLPFNLQVTPAFAGYMLMGAMCGQEKLLSKESGPFGSAGCKKPKWILLALGCFAACVVLGYFFPGGMDVSSGFFMQKPGYLGIGVWMILLQSITGLIFFFWICTLISLVSIPTKILSWFGRNTLPFYLTHMFVGITLYTVTGWSAIYLGADDPYGFLKTLIVYLATIGICALWTILVNKVKASIKRRKRKA